MLVCLKPVLETYDFNGRLYRHHAAYGRQWSSYYGAKGGGFGYLIWNEDRPAGRDYRDIGFGYEVKLRKGLAKVLFHGLITKIEETQGRDGRDAIKVTALGFGSLFENDIFNRVYADSRPAQWSSSEEENGAFKPKSFDTRRSLSDGLYLKPRQVLFDAHDYTYLRYEFPFGESVQRIEFDYDLALPETWPGKLEIRDSAGELWSSEATGTGSQTLAASSGSTYFEVRFYVTAAGRNTADADTVYGKLSNVEVRSKNQPQINTAMVMEDLVGFLTQHGLNSSVARIADPGLALPPTVAFEDDWTPKQIMEWCSQFGGRDNSLLAWGVELNDEKRAYLELQDLTTVKYIVRRRVGLEAQIQADFGQSTQKLYGVYSDADGQTQRTADVEDSQVMNKLGGHYRRGSYKLSGNVDNTTALEVVNLALSESSLPKVTTSFSVSDQIYTATGKILAIDEVQAGGIVMVDDFRAREATLASNDYRTQWSSFQLVGVEIDEEQNTARLIPAGDRRSFEQFLARLSSMRLGG